MRLLYLNTFYLVFDFYPFSHTQLDHEISTASVHNFKNAKITYFGRLCPKKNILKFREIIHIYKSTKIVYHL